MSEIVDAPALDELGPLPQWLCWQMEPPRGDSPKPVKMPYSPISGRHASTTASADWVDLNAALDARDEHPEWSGVGFVFTERDPYVGVDLDGCRDAESGALATWAHEIVTALDSYTEISPSGTGLHIFIRGKLPIFGRRKGHIELYETARYFTVTARELADTAGVIHERQAELAMLHAEIFGAASDVAAPRLPRSTRLVVTPDDRSLLDRMFNSARGDRIRRLWDGDTSMHGADDSGADLALCDYLAFWTAGDAGRIDRLFRESRLFRPKWDEKRGAMTYGARTIACAVSGKAVGGGVAA